MRFFSMKERGMLLLLLPLFFSFKTENSKNAQLNNNIIYLLL